ncbi:transketolase family protein [Pseudothermotoga sp.]
MNEKSKMASRHMVAQALMDLAREDEKIVVVTSDARGSASITEFFESFPKRAIEVGIAEQSAVGIAAGLALCGKKPFVLGPACFYSARAFEQVKNDVAYTGANVKIIGVSGGVSYGPLGSTHHALHDIAAFRAIPNIDVILPCDANQAYAVVKYVVNRERPAYIRVGRNPIPFVYDEPFFEIARGYFLRSGVDVTIIACGEVLWHALKACEILSKEGVEATLIDMPSIKPIDEEIIIKSARNTGKVVTAEEHSVHGGLGEAVSAILGKNFPAPVEILGIPDEFPVTGKQEEVLSHYDLDAVGIAKRVQKFLRRLSHGR